MSVVGGAGSERRLVRAVLASLGSGAVVRVEFHQHQVSPAGRRGYGIVVVVRTTARAAPVSITLVPGPDDVALFIADEFIAAYRDRAWFAHVAIPVTTSRVLVRPDGSRTVAAGGGELAPISTTPPVLCGFCVPPPAPRPATITSRRRLTAALHAAAAALGDKLQRLVVLRGYTLSAFLVVTAAHPHTALCASVRAYMRIVRPTSGAAVTDVVVSVLGVPGQEPCVYGDQPRLGTQGGTACVGEDSWLHASATPLPPHSTKACAALAHTSGSIVTEVCKNSAHSAWLRLKLTNTGPVTVPVACTITGTTRHNHIVFRDVFFDAPPNLNFGTIFPAGHKTITIDWLLHAPPAAAYYPNCSLLRAVPT